MSDTLIEQVVSAFRQRFHGELRSAPAWYDLSESEREAAFEQTLVSRSLEATLDPDGLSTTAHAVLTQIRGAR
jgi:hypothetical protein